VFQIGLTLKSLLCFLPDKIIGLKIGLKIF
jgi:hypothetical protein